MEELEAAPAVQLRSAELMQATSMFDEGRVLGGGGFGRVFRVDAGMLTSVGRVGAIAVKKLDADSMQGVHELQNEIDLLALCRHENLLPLLGFCLEPTARCLVYPLMAGGNLEDAIMDPKEGKPLKWKVRVRILRAACRALLYLHTPNETKGEVLHRDIKPANILLDEQNNAKLSDVGLATHKAASSGSQGGQTTTHHLSTKLKGTIGFLDPIYMQTGMFTPHADAYAMGMCVLLHALSLTHTLTNKPSLTLACTLSHTHTHKQTISHPLTSVSRCAARC